MQRDELGPRPTEVIANIIDRLSTPRYYAGDWSHDQAERILDALYDAGYAVRAIGPGRFPELDTQETT